MIIVTACGFQLRGGGQFQMADQKVLLVSETPYSEFDRQLKRDIDSAGAVLVSDSKQADVRLTIVSMDIQEQGVSRDATGRANEVILRAQLAFKLSRSVEVASQVTEGEIRQDEIRQLKISRSYYQDFRSPVSDRNLRKDARDTLYSELSRRLLLQVARINH